MSAFDDLIDSYSPLLSYRLDDTGAPITDYGSLGLDSVSTTATVNYEAGVLFPYAGESISTDAAGSVTSLDATTAPAAILDLGDGITEYTVLSFIQCTGTGSGSQSYWQIGRTSFEFRRLGSTRRVPFCVGVDNTGYPAVSTANSTTSFLKLTGPSLVNDGNPHMIGGVYKGQDVTLYVDDDGAVASGNITSDRSVVTGSHNIRINARSLDGGGSANYFNGFNQYEILIPSALTEEQIAGVYSMAATGSLPSGSGGLVTNLTGDIVTNIVTNIIE